jgi:hypothetical protein
MARPGVYFACPRACLGSAPRLLSLVSDNTGIALRLLSTAVRYWAAYPEEIDSEIAAADAAEAAAEQAWLRERRLLAG